MVDVAALGFSVNADTITKADRALDSMAASADKAAASAGRVAKSVNEEDYALRKAAVASQQAENRLWAARKAQEALENNTRRASVALREQVAAANMQNASVQKVVQTNGSARAGMQQLGYQINDVATMFSMGAKPAQIFSSQIGQITQAVQLMSGGTSRVAAFLGGPWGVALGAAVVVLAPFIGKIFEAKSALDEMGNAAVDAMNKLRASLAQATSVSTAMSAVAKERIGLLGEQAKIEADIARRSNGRTNPDGTPMFAFKQQQDLLAVQKKLAENAQQQNEIARTANTVIPMQQRNRDRLNATEEKSRSTRVKLTDAEKAHNAAIKAAQRDAEQQLKSSTDYADSLDKQIASIGKTAVELQRMEVAAQAALAPNAELAQRITETGAALETAQANQKAADWWTDLVKSAEELNEKLNQEQTALGLAGQALTAYTFAQEQLNKAKSDGRILSEAEIAAIHETSRLYAGRVAEIDGIRKAQERQAQSLNDARETVGEFFTSFLGGIREGGNVFKAFADSVINSLNRMVDKMLNSGLDALFGGGSGGGGGGIFSSVGKLLGIGGGPKATGVAMDFTKMADGGTFGTAQKFANGGTFTNQIVTQPTMFRFANGAALGEMGEAGPEAIMPLKRGADGSLGVQMHGGGGQPQRVQVEITDTTGLFVTRVQGQIAQSAPVLVDASASASQSKMAHRRTRALA